MAAPAGMESRTGTDDAEAALIERARELDDAAWAAIYERHAEQVYAYIYYRLGDQHIAEDLAADVFVKAVAGIKGYRYRGTPLLAWLYRIAHNVTVDHRKSAQTRMQRTSTDALERVEEPRDELGQRDQRQDMLAAIRRLTPDQQQVVILRFYTGMSNAEVAQVIGKPEGAVKALQTRALRSLRRGLEARDPERRARA
ncbi:MAG: sigma-70 family RNA polymerase sigma factor [Dehalococcoidia bacterium]|nr:sigma-70 family RNA polymerase sigma factor [Dehalococcoidia bacterium]